MEIKNDISPACDDKEYLREVLEAKRALELWTMEPGFQERFPAAPEVTLASYGLSIDAHAVKVLCVHEVALGYQYCPSEDFPRDARRYGAFSRKRSQIAIVWRAKPVCRSILLFSHSVGGNRTAAG